MKVFLYIMWFLLIFIKQDVECSAQQTSVPYQSGENLKYLMHYGWIDGGEASLSLKKKSFNGKEVYYAKAIGKTIGIAHAIYHVIDIYESWFDVNTGLPYKSIMDITENKYTNYNMVYYNQAGKTLNSKKSGNKILKTQVFDILASFYHLRKSLKNMHVGKTVTIHTYFHDEPWDMVVRYKGTESIKTKFGEISCMKFEPIVEKGTFKDEDALDIWISDDRNRIPIRVSMKLFVGSFKTDLIEYSGLKHPIIFEK